MINVDERSVILDFMKSNCAYGEQEQFYMGEFDRGYRGYINVNWRERTAIVTPPPSILNKPKRIDLDVLLGNIEQIATDMRIAIQTANAVQ